MQKKKLQIINTFNEKAKALVTQVVYLIKTSYKREYENCDHVKLPQEALDPAKKGGS